MNIEPHQLQTLHRLHRQQTDLKERLVRGPKQIQAAEANVKRAELAVTSAKDAYKKARVASDEKQLQLKQREARLKDLQGKLNAAESNREYQAIKEQMAADTKANSVLTDEILETFEQLEQLQAGTKEAETQLVKIKEELERIRARVTGEQAGLESELARVQREMGEVETTLPPEFLTELNRVAKVRGEGALAPVEGESCGGCFQMLTANMLNMLQLHQTVFCKSCGCLLYLPEE